MRGPRGQSVLPTRALRKSRPRQPGVAPGADSIVPKPEKFGPQLLPRNSGKRTGIDFSRTAINFVFPSLRPRGNSHATIRIDGKLVLPRAFDLYLRRLIDWVDAYHAAVVESRAETELVSLDRDFDRVPGLRRRKPWAASAGQSA